MADTSLSIDLALASGAALAGGAAARLLRQSVLVGYIAAGVAIGPFTPGPTGDPATIERLADIGVVLLMFGIGVHFSLRDLARARTAALGALLQVPIAVLVVAAVMLAVGWPWRQAVFSGAAASISGGTVLTKLLAERGEEETAHGRLAVGWSVTQDLLTVLLVVLLDVVAEPGGNIPAALGGAVLKAGAFIGGMVLIGTRVLPWLLGHIARLGSRELFILAVAGLSIGTAVISEQFGLSLALGAFIAGVVVSESDLSHHALGEVLPIREIFAALFFVSVGMLIDPALLWERLLLFLLLAGLVLSKGVIVSVVALLFRHPAITAALAGAGLAQSAEFSFILARQGVDAGVVSGTAFSLILSATAATTVLAPLLFRLAPPAGRALRALPLPAPRELPDAAALPRLRNHVVICGAGRVGGVIAGVLRRRGQGYLLIETDRRRMEALRSAGEPVVYGNAAAPPVLDQAQLAHARTLVVAVPDSIATRQIVEEARRRRPDLDIVVRAGSAEEADILRARGVAEAVVAERELALEITRHTLHRIGVSTLEAQAVLQRLRFEPE